MAARVLVLLSLVSVAAAGLPSCEEDTVNNCLGDDNDMSPEGISKCLAALGDALTDDCKAFQAVMAACHDELMVAGGICTAEQTNGEGMPCLMQRTPLDKLDGNCKDAVAARKGSEAPDTSLRGTFWSDGKRKLDDDEIEQLSEEDQELYNRWWKRKQKRSGANSDVKYAIKKQKMAKEKKIITHKAAVKVQEMLESMDASASPKEKSKAGKKAALRVVKKMAKKSELSWSKDELKEMAKGAVKAAKKQIKLDAQNANKGL